MKLEEFDCDAGDAINSDRFAVILAIDRLEEAITYTRFAVNT